MAGRRHLRLREHLAPFPRTPLAIKTHTSEYYASITYLDEQFGRILDAQKKGGRSDNLYVIFTSNHGLALGRHGLMGKQSLYDHSIRAPFVIVGPGVPAGLRVDEDIYLQDAMAPVLNLAQLQPPADLEFTSVLPLLYGAPSNYSAIYGAYLDRQRMIRQDDYKLIVFPTTNTVHLFNLADDPHEVHDLAGTPVQINRVEAMLADLQTLQADYGDELSLAPTRKIFLTQVDRND